MSIFLIVLAIILIGVGYKILAVRFGSRWVEVGPLCMALGVSLLILVIGSMVADNILAHASGWRDWNSNGTFRGVLVLSIALVVGYWVWIVYRSRYPDD